MEIVSVEAGPRLVQARAIFAEYGASIAGVAACSLQYQHFDHELETLPGKYGPPRGRIYLAYEGGAGRGRDEEPVGCIALRALPELGAGVCELKRMYVRPTARGRGVGRLLAKRIIQDAARIGYTLMKLDTSASMVEAQRLYRSLGFVPCAAYNEDPDQDTLWFERVIRPEDADL